IMTTDGQLAFELTHPKFNKSKTYKIALSMPLGEDDLRHVKRGVALDDGPSKLELTPINPDDHNNWKVVMSEGRNRQIRRTFEALGYHVVKLHRTHFGPYTLRDLRVGKHSLVTGDN
ncbi:rRNA pseudouridine synthase, partial [Candidatus Saccharibacteria bacterium]|nr:rRNA pseudouridine synthase [Candidatus Saccharibacteria bacterium]